MDWSISGNLEGRQQCDDRGYHWRTVSRLKHFVLAPGVEVAAVDTGEAQVRSTSQHKASARKRSTLEFQVEWMDGEISWEPCVRKLEAVDEYIRNYSRARLKGLLQKK